MSKHTPGPWTMDNRGAELLAALQVMVDASRESDLTALANRIDRARQTAEDVIKKVCGQ